MLSNQILIDKEDIDIVVGRPRISKQKQSRIITMHLQNKSYRIISERLGISIGTVHNYLKN